MAAYKMSSLMFSFFFSLMLLVTQSSLAIYAKGIVQPPLTLERTTINASVVDPEKNLLKVTNAADLNPVVSIKPDKKTLANGKAVKIEGTIEGGNLVIDLTKLGPANLLPKGKYILNASRGTTKLRATFEIIPPTLIIGKLKIPVPASGENLARLKYQVASGTAPSKSATITLHTRNKLGEIAEGTKGITVNSNRVIEINEVTQKEQAFDEYQYVQELPADANKKRGDAPVFIGAIFNAEPSEGAPPKETQFYAAVPMNKTNKKTNINNGPENVLSQSSTLAAKDIASVYTLAESASEEANLPPPNYDFDKTISDLYNVFGDIGQNTDSLGAGYDLVKEVAKAGSSQIANANYDSVNFGEPQAPPSPQAISTPGNTGESQAPPSPQAISTPGNIESNNPYSQTKASIALNVTGIAPGLTTESTSAIEDSSRLNGLLENPDPYALGTVQVNFPIPTEVSAFIYEHTDGITPGSLERNRVGDLSPRDQALEGEGFAYTLNEKKTVENIKELQNNAQSFARALKTVEGTKEQNNADKQKFNTLSVYPGVQINLSNLFKEVQASGINSGGDFNVNVRPGAIVSGGGSGDTPPPSQNIKNIKVSLDQGAIAGPGVTSFSNVSINSNSDQYSDESVNGLAVSKGFAVVPTAVAKNVPPGAQFISSLGNKPAEDVVFSAPPGNRPGESGNNNQNQSGIKSFVAGQANDFINAFFSGGSSQNDFIKNSAATFSTYFNNIGASVPAGLNNLITVPPRDISQENIGITSSLGDIVEGRGGQVGEGGQISGDLTSIFSAGGFAGGGKPRPSEGGPNKGGNNPFGGPGENPKPNSGGNNNPFLPPIGDQGNSNGGGSNGGGSSNNNGPTVIESNTGGTGNDTVILSGGGGPTPMPSGGKLPTSKP